MVVLAEQTYCISFSLLGVKTTENTDGCVDGWMNGCPAGCMVRRMDDCNLATFDTDSDSPDRKVLLAGSESNI